MNTFAERFNGVSGSAIRDIFKVIAKPGMISFAGGNPAPESFETEVIADIASEVLRRDGKRIMQYGASEGLPEYRAAVRSFLSERGVAAEDGDILPVSGSTQAIDLIMKALINKGDAVLVENPSFLGAFQTMRMYQTNLIPIETDDSGAIPSSVERLIETRHPKAIYLIPTFQNPTGVTTTLERRKEIAAIVARHEVYLIEDDPYRDLRYAGEPLPSIYSFDTTGRVIYLASFSKLISPGLRVGAVVARGDIMRKLVIGKQTTDLHSDQLSQAIVAEYLARGLLASHINDIVRLYRPRLDAMLKGLDALGISHTTPEGGLFVFARLGGGQDAKALLERAVGRGVAFVPGTFFYVDGGHDDTLRLNFSNSDEAQIERGIGAMGEVR